MKRFLKSLRDSFVFVGQLVATIVNTALLLVVYALGVGLTAIVAKCVGKSFLALKIDRESATYWRDIPQKKEAIDQYYRQF